MLFKKGELKQLWPFYLSRLIEGLSMVITPFIAIYFIGLGFTFLQISIITAVYGLSMLIFEIPTSAFADGFSRKYSMLIGLLIVAIAFTLIPLVTDFKLIILLHIFGGLGMAFTSGTEEAWIIDNLKEEGRDDLRQEYFIKINIFLAMGAIFAPIIGAVLAKYYSIKLLWFVFSFGFFVNAVLVITCCKEHSPRKNSKPLDLVRKTYHNSLLSLMYSLRHKVVFFSVVAGLFTQFMSCSFVGNQQFLVSLGMKENQLGYMYSIAEITGLLTVFFSRFLTKYKPKNVMSFIVLIVMTLLLSLLFVPPPFFIVACAIFIMKDGIMAMGSPIYQTYLHSFIPGKIRASTLSVNNMATQLVIALSSIVAGVLLDFFGPQKVISLAGLFGIAAIFFYQKIKD
jgi:MFS family permease